MARLAERVSSLSGSVFSNLAASFEAFDGERFPLHVGDTWLAPPEGCRMEDLLLRDHPGMNRYSPVPGLPALVGRVAEVVAARTGVAVERNEVLVSNGATGCLSATVGALVTPGDHVLVLAPAWPLFAGMVPAFGGSVTHVHFIGEVDAPEAVAEVMDRYASDRTVAVYLNTPNNPTGRVIGRPVLEALVAWAQARDIWLVCDEVYDQLQYVGTHTYLRSLAPERTCAVWSFSKGYGMAGHRCGFMVGPAEVVGGARKLATYLSYCAPRPSQESGLIALGEAGDRWVAEARVLYAELGRAAADRLRVPHPEGGTFLFMDVSEHLDERGLVGFLGRCVERGLLLAPGTTFGPYPGHVRLCFTSVEPERVLRGVDVLAELLGR